MFMKKVCLLFAAIIGLNTVFASNALDALSSTMLAVPNVHKGGDNHIEYRYYGIYGVVDFSYMTNIKPEHDGYKDDYSLMGFTASAGFQWRKECGLGLGFSYLNDATGAFSQIPVFIEFRSHYLRSRLTPFSDFQLGYSIPFGSSSGGDEYIKITKGGITFGAAVGARFAFTRNIAANFSVGYQMIQLRQVERGYMSVASTSLPELYHNLKVSVGLNF